MIWLPVIVRDRLSDAKDHIQSYLPIEEVPNSGLLTVKVSYEFLK